MYCPICGKENPAGSSFCQFCGVDLRNPYTQRSGDQKYAGFWRRFGAAFSDQILLAFIGMILANIFARMEGNSLTEDGAMGLFFLLYFTASWLYYALMESSPNRATLGKMALDI